jgi:hypothetical protein
VLLPPRNKYITGIIGLKGTKLAQEPKAHTGIKDYRLCTGTFNFPGAKRYEASPCFTSRDKILVTRDGQVSEELINRLAILDDKTEAWLKRQQCFVFRVGAFSAATMGHNKAHASGMVSPSGKLVGRTLPGLQRQLLAAWKAYFADGVNDETRIPIYRTMRNLKLRAEAASEVRRELSDDLRPYCVVLILF